MSLKATSPRPTLAQDASRRTGLRGLRSNPARAAAKARAQARRAPPPSRMQSSAATIIEDSAPLTAHERNMARLIGLGLWGGMAGYLFLQRAALFAAAESGLRALGLA